MSLRTHTRKDLKDLLVASQCSVVFDEARSRLAQKVGD